MRILIVAALFHDNRAIGSQRPRELSKELASQGHEITVLTAPSPDKSASYDNPGVSLIHDNRMGPSSLSRHVRGVIRSVKANLRSVQKQSDGGRALHWGPSSEPGSPPREGTPQARLKMAASWFAHLPEHLSRVRGITKDLPMLFPEEHPFDYVICTYGPLISLSVGTRVADLRLANKLVTDFRDPMDPYVPYGAIMRGILGKLQARYINKSDHVTAVSEGVKESLLARSNRRGVSEKITVLTNGYPSTLDDRHIHMRQGDQLRIGYFGNLAPLRDIGMLLDAIASDPQLSDTVEIHYAGAHCTELMRQARQRGLNGIIHDHGVISHEESLVLQAEMDILLALTWNLKHQQGVLTGKFFEYLGAKKPIVALVQGDVPGAEISTMISELGVGQSFEYVAGPAEQNRLRRFLTQAAKDVAAGIPIIAEEAFIGSKRYSYKAIAARLIDTLDAIPS